MPRASATGEDAALSGGLTSATTLYVSLHSGDPGTNGANEIVGGTYIRVSVSWATASNGLIANSNTLNINVPASTTISYFGLWSASTAGTYYIGGALSAPQTFNTAGVYQIGAGGLTISAS